MPDYFQCKCPKCTQTFLGYKLQTSSVIAKHAKLHKTPTEKDSRGIGADQIAQPPVPGADGGSQLDAEENLGCNWEVLGLGWWGDDDDAADDEDRYVGSAAAVEQPLLSEHVHEQPPPQRPLGRRNCPDTVWIPTAAVDVRPPGSDLDESDQPDATPRGLREHPGVRIAYLQAVIQNVYAHASVVQASEILNNTLDALSTMGPLPVNPRPVRTLESAKRRLGIDADQFITQYAICPKCWKHYTPKQILELESPECLVDDCDGVLYGEYQSQKGLRRRKALKINPYTSIIQTLRRFFLRPGFAAMIRDNRDTRNGHCDDEEFVMRDIHDGACWDSCYTNTIREVGNRGSVQDVPKEGDVQENLNSHRFGLHLTVNTDWYVQHQSKYSYLH